MTKDWPVKWHWLDTVYHRREHSSLETTPLLRWQRDIARVRQLPPATDMRRLFFHPRNGSCQPVAGMNGGCPSILPLRKREKIWLRMRSHFCG